MPVVQPNKLHHHQTTCTTTKRAALLVNRFAPQATPKRMEDPRPGSLNDGRDGLRRVELDVLVPKM